MKTKRQLSDMLFIVGIVFIALLTGILIGAIGKTYPSYIVDEIQVSVLLIAMLFPFLVGYWSGRFYVEEK